MSKSQNRTVDKHIIWSDMNLNPDDWRDSYKDFLKSMKSTGIRMTNTGCTNIWLKPMASIFPMNGKILMSSLLSRLLSSATSADGTAE